jgi:hypothetical protein
MLMETVFGSHLYGTATPTSDRDWKAVAVPPARDILLQRAKPTIVTKTKADPLAKNTAEDVDVEVWALHQFFKLVSEGQTVAMDALFSTPAAWVREPHPLWLEIVENRRRLLSRRASSFLGYARQQSSKYGIKGSRMAAARAARDFFVPLLDVYARSTPVIAFEDRIRRELCGLEHIEFAERATPSDGTLNHVSVCNRLVPLTAGVKVAAETYARLFDQYGERARQAERNEGVDWKALSHAVRVGRQAIELLETGHVSFPRPEAAFLLSIKRGELPYARVAEEIEELLPAVENAAANSVLPAEPDRAFMDDVIMRAYRAEVRDELVGADG